RDDFVPSIGAEVPRRMKWLYEDNPRGPAVTFMGVIDETGEAVGCASYFPRQLVIQGESKLAGVLCDFAVNKQHRTAGAAIAVQRGLAKSASASGFTFLFGFPNEASVAVCKRVGYKSVGATTTWVKPLKSAYKVRSFTPAPFMVRPASAVVDAGLEVIDRAISAFVGGSGTRGISIARPDERFDALWERARPKRGIAGERTRAYLDWRYAGFTTAQHEFFCITKDGGKTISGYAVYAIDDNRAVLQDLFCEDFEETADALLVELARHLRQKGVWSLVLSYLGPEIFGERLRRLGFFKRPGERIMIVYLDASLTDGQRREITDVGNWFMLDGELDI
ncbi:MAG: GNAT family N-acetyltransferase, partial [Polyangiaceae bacterium]